MLRVKEECVSFEEKHVSDWERKEVKTRGILLLNCVFSETLSLLLLQVLLQALESSLLCCWLRQPLSLLLLPMVLPSFVSTLERVSFWFPFSAPSLVSSVCFCPSSSHTMITAHFRESLEGCPAFPVFFLGRHSQLQNIILFSLTSFLDASWIVIWCYSWSIAFFVSLEFSLWLIMNKFEAREKDYYQAVDVYFLSWFPTDF